MKTCDKKFFSDSQSKQLLLVSGLRVQYRTSNMSQICKQRGKRVVLIDINAVGLNKVYASLSKKCGDNRHLQLCGDVTDSKFANKICSNIQVSNAILYVVVLHYRRLIKVRYIFRNKFWCHFMFIYQVALGRKKQKDVAVFESSCHLTSCLQHTVEASYCPF